MKKHLTTENTRVAVTNNGIEVQVKQVRLVGGQPPGELKESVEWVPLPMVDLRDKNHD